MGRLTIELTDEQHKHLKAVAALQGKTIKAYAVERLFPVDVTAEWTDDEKAAWNELSDLLGKRIDSALAGSLSNKTVTEIFDEVLARGQAA